MDKPNGYRRLIYSETKKKINIGNGILNITVSYSFCMPRKENHIPIVYRTKFLI
jgi:hypothetical protein